MEGLHVAMEDAMLHGVIRGVQVKENNMLISHLFNAYDALFMAECNMDNIKNLISIIRCYYLASGLKLNLQKSNPFGVGVDLADTQSMVAIIGVGH